MRIFVYFLAAGAGLIGVSALLRTFEQFLTGNGIFPAQLAIVVISFVIVFALVRKARAMK